MMTDIYGKEHHTVGDYTCHPEWIAYGEKLKAWLKSLNMDDWMMMSVKKKVEKSTSKDQMILPIFPEWKLPEKPIIPINLLLRSLT